MHVKVLTLVRHAKSSWKDPNLSDFDRPLNARGKRCAPLMGKRLAARAKRPDLILSSPARRAVATMRKMMVEAGGDEREIVTDVRLYEADANQLLDLVRDIDDNRSNVLICGHNPGLTDLCNLLSNCFIDNIPTCGIVSLGFHCDSWKEVEPRSGELIYFDYPKKAWESG